MCSPCRSDRSASRAGSPRRYRPTSPRAISAAVRGACAAALFATTLAAAPLDPRVAERAAGSERAQAEAIVAAILPHRFAAQVLKVRVDGAMHHRVAGITVSGTKFHEPLNEARFVGEIAQLVALAFRDPTIEETDIWATVPLDAGHGAVVSGDLARPTSRNVFTLTVPRAEAGRVAALAASRDAFWDPTFRASLRAAR